MTGQKLNIDRRLASTLPAPEEPLYKQPTASYAAKDRELHRVVDEGAPYAAGWGVDPESGQHRHNGSAGTFFSYLTIDPKAMFNVSAHGAQGGPGGGSSSSPVEERWCSC